MIKVNAEQILLAREKRVEIQNYISARFGLPILVVRVNYPGLDRDNNVTRGIANYIKDEISVSFANNIIYSQLIFTAEGPIYIAAIKDTPTHIKETSIKIEEKHPLGRLVDIDVYDSEGNGISRGELGYAMRKCYLCNDIAQCCVRSRKHSIEEVIEYINNKYQEFVCHGDVSLGT
ncbi:citrate lyase holo-[acyl-carrier protein] synthase [Clostridium omnivorum]|uniref:citrate lyase holo-[acyl-carrier protein] synthase n=1 Tax=Clostridium omnivorum TaxID=1604902 RepID=A0ABQ5N3L1_9CLOT|nr:citrate lyase holo-[acyl-carrier protein] synthase [Clostridium sp. E14]GLC29765.1 putative apo-citrate lyase phosphoribosyl-dephospho-CoA transferase [Clostridium sp. E14]